MRIVNYASFKEPASTGNCFGNIGGVIAPLLDFDCQFAPDNWTLTQNSLAGDDGALGTADATGAPASISMTAYNGGGPDDEDLAMVGTSLKVTIPNSLIQTAMVLRMEISLRYLQAQT